MQTSSWKRLVQSGSWKSLVHEVHGSRKTAVLSGQYYGSLVMLHQAFLYRHVECSARLTVSEGITAQRVGSFPNSELA